MRNKIAVRLLSLLITAALLGLWGCGSNSSSDGLEYSEVPTSEETVEARVQLRTFSVPGLVVDFTVTIWDETSSPERVVFFQIFPATSGPVEFTADLTPGRNYRFEITALFGDGSLITDNIYRTLGLYDFEPEIVLYVKLGDATEILPVDVFMSMDYPADIGSFTTSPQRPVIGEPINIYATAYDLDDDGDPGTNYDNEVVLMSWSAEDPACLLAGAGPDGVVVGVEGDTILSTSLTLTAAVPSCNLNLEVVDKMGLGVNLYQTLNADPSAHSNNLQVKWETYAPAVNLDKPEETIGFHDNEAKVYMGTNKMNGHLRIEVDRVNDGSWDFKWNFFGTITDYQRSVNALRIAYTPAAGGPDKAIEIKKLPSPGPGLASLIEVKEDGVVLPDAPVPPAPALDIAVTPDAADFNCYMCHPEQASCMSCH